MEPFDLDEWIAAAGRPTRTVTIYGRADVLSRLDEIDAEVKATRRRQNSGEKSLTELGEDERAVEALEEEWETLAGVFSASALHVTIQGLTEAEEAAAVRTAEQEWPDIAKTGNAEYEEKVGLRVVAAAIVSPAFTLEQLTRLHHRIGAAAFGPLALASSQLNRATPQVPATPFSSPPSRAART